MNPTRRVTMTVLFVAGVGCGGATQGLNQTSITCPAGRTLLDGVCASDPVADYVACVRAQGAQLGQDRGQRLSAAAGYAGAKAEVASEVREALEKKYSTSDSNALEVIRACGKAFGGGGAGQGTRAWRPAKLGEFTFAQTVSALEEMGEVVAKSDFSPTGPKLLATTEQETYRTFYEDERWTMDLNRDNWFWFMELAPLGGDFAAHLKVNLVSSSPKGFAWVLWGAGAALELHADGSVVVERRDAADPKPRFRSNTAAFRAGQDVNVYVHHQNGRASIWIDGEKAFSNLELPFQPKWVSLGAGNQAKAAYDDVVVVRLR